MSLEYLAGIIDGEGSISILRSKHKITPQRVFYQKYTLRLSVDSTNLQLIRYLKENFGGHIHQRKERTTKWNTVWVWYCGGKEAAFILKKSLPFLIVKKNQAELALEFQATFNETGAPFKVPNAILQKREMLYLKLRELNKRKHGRREPKS